MRRPLNKRLRWSKVGRRLAQAYLAGGCFLVRAGLLVLTITCATWIIAKVLTRCGAHAGAAAMLVTAGSSVLLCGTAFSLGVASLADEVSTGTAESLVLTPAPKELLLRGRLTVIAKILCLTALLLPLYCCTVDFECSGLDCDVYSITAHMQGMRGRFLTALRYWDDPRSGDTTIFIGIAALCADFCWYLMCAAGGMLAAVLSRGRRIGWVFGFILVLAAVVLLCCADGLLLELSQRPAPVAPPANQPWGWWEMQTGDAYCLGSFLLLVVRVTPAAVPRLFATSLFLRLAARHLDRLADG